MSRGLRWGSGCRFPAIREYLSKIQVLIVLMFCNYEFLLTITDGQPPAGLRDGSFAMRGGKANS